MCACVWVVDWLCSFVHNSSGEGIVNFYAVPNHCLLNKMFFNQTNISDLDQVNAFEIIVHSRGTLMFGVMTWKSQA